MFAHNIAAVTLSALTVVSAITSNWTIDITKVDVSTRSSWCTAERNTCDQLCLATQNTCDFQTLDYACVCDDGSDPKLGQYLNTIETFTCQEAYKECNLANVGNKQGQDNCTSTIMDNCGTKDPSKKQSGGSGSGSGSASSSSAAAPSATSGSSPVSSQTPQASKPAAKSAGVSLTVVSYLGNGAAALAVAAFAYMI